MYVVQTHSFILRSNWYLSSILCWQRAYLAVLLSCGLMFIFVISLNYRQRPRALTDRFTLPIIPAADSVSVRQQDYDAQACNCIIFWLTDLLLARSMEMDVIGWFRTLGLIQRPPKSGNAKEIDNRHPVAVVGTWSVCISLPHEVYRRYFWPHHAESLKKQLFV